MKLRGIKYIRSDEEIRQYLRMPLESKLSWLEEFNAFTYKLLRGRRLKVWKKFIKGEL